MFIPDTAVATLAQDELGRAPFARHLAERILAWRRPESLVIALFGPWGSGKTSVMNMVVEHIENASANRLEAEKPIIIRFNPWYFSGQQELLKLFLSQLLTQVEKTGAKNIRAIREQLTKYGTILSSAPPIPGLKEWTNLAGTAAQALGANQDLNGLREQLNKGFLELNRQVVILIDDVDRLNQDEIRQIFRLIKLNADFPNTIYLIAADRRVLVESLKSTQGIAGQDYLEKIVQVGFDIPIPDSTSLSNFLKNQLAKIPEIQMMSEQDQQRWASIYNSGFRTLFNTLRSIKRYSSSLSFHAQVIGSEVNGVDLLAIEAVRVFAPEVYHGISKRKALFTLARTSDSQDIVDRLQDRQLSNEALKDLCEIVYKMAPAEYQEQIRNICLELFPAIRLAYRHGGHFDGELPQWRQDRRICSPDIFDLYFLLHVPQHEVSRADLERLKEHLGNVPNNELDQTVEGLSRDARLDRILELLPDIIGNLSSVGLESLGIVLIRLAERTENKTRDFFDFGTDVQLTQLLRAVGHKMDGDTVHAWLRQKILSEPGIFLLTKLVSWQRDDGEGPVQPNAIFGEDLVKELEASCVERFQELAATDRLLQARNPLYQLTRWKKWDPEPAHIEQYVAKLLGTADNSLALIRLFGYEKLTISDDGTESSWAVDADSLVQFVPQADLPETITLIESSGIALSAQDQAVLEILKARYPNAAAAK